MIKNGEKFKLTMSEIENIKFEEESIYEEDEDDENFGRFDEFDKFIFKEYIFGHLKKILLILTIIILGYSSMEIYQKFKDDRMQMSIQEKAMIAFDRYLTGNEILEWCCIEAAKREKLVFSILDLDGDRVPEMLVQNVDSISSMTPIQKIFKYKNENVIELWGSIGAYDLFVGYNNSSKVFVTRRAVKGVESIFIYDALHGSLLGEKCLVDDPHGNEFLPEPVSVKVQYYWMGSEVELEIFNQKLYEMQIRIDNLEKSMNFVENSLENRKQYLKYRQE